MNRDLVAFSGGLDGDTYQYVQRALASDDENFRLTALSLIESNVEPLERISYYFQFGFEPPTVPFPPINPNWPEFLAELNRIGVWSWQPEYSDPNVLDGTGWSLTIRWGDKTINTGGSNAYPRDAEGTRAPYNALIASIRKQIGGRALF